jgi:hypothetical protein
LNTARPTIGWSELLRAVKNAILRSPIRPSCVTCSGLNVHGRPGATLASKRMVIGRSVALTLAACAAVARCVVPAKPVAWQNMR